MSRRHGRAVMPFGKHKGVRLRLLPDDYLSWLTTIDLSRFSWLKDSLMAELEFRGMNIERVEDPDVAPSLMSQTLDQKRKIVLE